MDFNKKSRVVSLSISALLHLFFLLCLIFLSLQSSKDKTSQSSPAQITSYVYQEKPTPMIQQRRSRRAKSADNKSTQKFELPKKNKTTNQEIASQSPPRKSILASSMEVLRKDQMNEMIASQKDMDPIYLLGDLNAPSDPFILLLAKAISANFSYPKLPGEMGIKGKALVSFIVHPEGYFSNVQLVQSTHNDDLDRAALYAINEAPKIDGLDRFLFQPRRLVVGFIFW